MISGRGFDPDDPFDPFDDPDYLAHVSTAAKACRCCQVCSDVPCAGCMAGGMCDQTTCRCQDDDVYPSGWFDSEEEWS